MVNQQRIEDLKRKLASSMHAGKPMGGYEQRVKAIRAELAKLEAEDGE